ncbi:MAG: Rpn family recombination-promoting nuclease/putative transposase [Magnetococcales bacterium]|nr:Rpn family recombination-promoting nuclease/putative transposase [Magnetococcales bacterium]
MASTANAPDSLYHRLFEHPEMVIDLLCGFLDPVMLAELDLANLRRHNTKFTAHTGQRRRSDVVWEIPTRHGGSIFLLLMIEFQSEIEEWMVLRIGVYTGLLYQQLVSERKLKESDGLPPVLPIVLFNGEPRWNVATSLRNLIRLPTSSSLWNFQPEMRYYVIDEGVFPKEMLKGVPYLTAILFRMEYPTDPKTMVAAGQDVAEWFRKNPDGPPVKRLFLELLQAGLTRLKIDPLPSIPEDLQEVVVMLTAHIDRWAQEYKQEGRQEEAVSMLLRQVHRKFGQTPDWVTEKVRSAKLELIEVWGENVLFANLVDEVFADRQ